MNQEGWKRRKERKRERERDERKDGERGRYECLHGIWRSKYATRCTIFLSVVNEYREGQHYTNIAISYSQEFKLALQ